jgi:hypothetical protein
VREREKQARAGGRSLNMFQVVSFCVSLAPSWSFLQNLKSALALLQWTTFSQLLFSSESEPQRRRSSASLRLLNLSSLMLSSAVGRCFLRRAFNIVSSRLPAPAPSAIG